MEDMEPKSDERLRAEDLQETWAFLDGEERLEGFRALDRVDAEQFFMEIGSAGQAHVLRSLTPAERRLWIRLLAPDDAADLIQECEYEARAELLALLDEKSRAEVTALLAYAEDDAGGLMSPRFARLRPDMDAEAAIRYLRKQANEQVETIYYAYVLDNDQKLKGVVSFRDLMLAPTSKPILDIMVSDVVTVADTEDQETVARLIKTHDFSAVPVIDAEGRMRGIVTVDDAVDVVEEEATEDIHKLGGLEALDLPYMDTTLLEMVRKRGGWLAALFLGEMLTASAMSYYEKQIEAAVVLALFVPLIISSGGNSGSQATTLVIRAMALGEVRLQDWGRILWRELLAGLSLGGLLAVIGFARIVTWQALFPNLYGEHYLLVAGTVAISLIGVVLWGTISGSMLPLMIRRVGLDPASASAPFVATLVDVSGLIIYFQVARVVLAGTILK